VASHSSRKTRDKIASRHLGCGHGPSNLISISSERFECIQEVDRFTGVPSCVSSGRRCWQGEHLLRRHHPVARETLTSMRLITVVHADPLQKSSGDGRMLELLGRRHWQDASGFPVVAKGARKYCAGHPPRFRHRYEMAIQLSALRSLLRKPFADSLQNEKANTTSIRRARWEA